MMLLKGSGSLHKIMALFILILLLWIGHNLFLYDSSGHGFIFGDWLVNYQDGGFKRRGLTGSIFFWLQDLTGISLMWIVYSCQMVLYVLFFYFLLKLIEGKKISLLYFTLVISPLTFLIYFNDNGMVGRKEIIFLTIFIYYLYLIKNNKLNLFREYLIYAFLILATFLHEITVFYIPYFIVAHYSIYKKIDFKKYALFFATCLIPAALIFFLGGETNEGESLLILAKRGVELDSYSIFSFSNDLWVQLDKYSNNIFGYSAYIISMVIGMVHFGFYIKTETKFNYSKALILFFVLILYSIPLFILACDWGRWLQIHFLLFLLILTFHLPPKSESKDISKPLFSFLNRNFQYFALILFLFIWCVKHFNSGLSYDGVLTSILLSLSN